MYRNPCLFWHCFLHYISWEGIHASSQKFPQRSLHPCVQHVQRSESSPDPLFPERTVRLTSYTAFTTFAAKRFNTDHLCSSHTVRFRFFFSLGLTYRSIILTYPSVCLLYVMLVLKSIFYDMHFSRTYKRAVSKTKSATPSSFSYEFPITWYWLNVWLIKQSPVNRTSIPQIYIVITHNRQDEFTASPSNDRIWCLVMFVHYLWEGGESCWENKGKCYWLGFSEI